MKKEYEVRLYRPGDEEEIVELLQLVFDEWPDLDLKCSPLEHWRWKFEDNPLKMNSIAVGESNNRIIGFLHGIYRRIKIGKKAYYS